MSLHDLERAESEFVENWHVTAICAHLEAVARGDLRYLIVNQPPRSSKTELTGLRWRLGRTVGRWLAGVELVDDTDDE